MAPKVRSLHDAAKVEDYVAKGWFSRETVDDLYRESVSRNPDGLAIVDPANKEALTGAAPRRLTWRELDDEVTALTARFIELGLRRGDILATQMVNSVELVEVYLAAWNLGVVVSPLAVQYREHEITGMAKQAQFKAFLGTGRAGERDLVAEVLAYRDSVPSIELFLRYAAPGDESAAPDGAVNVAVASATDADRASVANRREADGPNDPNDAVTICWTSGTEAEPKGVPRTHLEWVAGTWAGVDMPKITADDVILNPFPMINMAAFVGLLLPWLRMGCTLVQHQPFDLMVFLGQIAKERVNYTVAPPALLMMLLHNEALMSQVDISSITRMGSGSAPLPPPMVVGWQEKYGVPIINFFGSNEGIALLSGPEDFPDPATRARYFPYYSGQGRSWSSRISKWVQHRLVDIETGEEITEPGKIGELRIDGPTVFPGYINGEDKPSPFDEHGYLKSGDLFEIAGDEGQYLLYVDRAKDLVIRGGMNIAPAEVEGLIAHHPAVGEVAVFGQPDEVMGERVTAVVALKPDQSLTLDELAEFLREKHIASYKIPERLEIVPMLPRNPVGKVLKRDLRASLT